MELTWDKATKDTLTQVLTKMPVFMRPIAEKAITLKAESLAKKDNIAEVTEKYLVDALFAETPFGFQGLMKNDLVSLGVDYMKYGYQR